MATASTPAVVSGVHVVLTEAGNGASEQAAFPYVFSVATLGHDPPVGAPQVQSQASAPVRSPPAVNAWVDHDASAQGGAIGGLPVARAIIVQPAGAAGTHALPPTQPPALEAVEVLDTLPELVPDAALLELLDAAAPPVPPALVLLLPLLVVDEAPLPLVPPSGSGSTFL